MNQFHKPPAMDKQLDVLRCHADGGLLLGASCMTGRYWLGSLWYYQTPESAPNVDKCTAGVQLEAGVCDAQWIDSTHITVGLDTGGIAVWNLEDDYRTFVLSHAAAGHDGVVSSVSVVCDKTKAASSGHDRCIKIWDLSNMSLIYISQAHSDLVSAVDCHPTDPDILVSCGQDDKILLWDRRTSKPASIINKSSLRNTPTCVQWQPGCIHKMAVGSEGGQIAILDTRKGVDNYLTSTPHSRCVYRLQFCPKKPNLLASVSEDCMSAVTAVCEDGLKQVYTDNTHMDFVHGLSWVSESQLYTCGWDAKVLSHDITKVATASMDSGILPPSVQLNGESGDHKEQIATGDKIESMDTDIADLCKTSSCGETLHVQPEISSEG